MEASDSPASACAYQTTRRHIRHTRADLSSNCPQYALCYPKQLIRVHKQVEQLYAKYFSPYSGTCKVVHRHTLGLWHRAI